MKKTQTKLIPTIIYEDADVLVLNKPAGLVVHADGRTDDYTLSTWLLEKYPEIKDVGEIMLVKNKEGKEVAIIRPGIVHRLDRETTGVMIVAKNQKAFYCLKKQFQNHTAKKTYRAFVYGFIKNDMGTIDAPIGRNANDIRMFNAGRGARGVVREAKTMYRVLKRFADISEVEYESQNAPINHRFSYVELYPQTGRTHQIRVHLKFINHPVVSDYLYANTEHTKEKALGFDRVALHSYSLDIKLPDGRKDKFIAPLPTDFLEAEALMNN